MEGGNGSSSSSSSRWSPTKEQISILEGLYKQGIRTPSAEQIQEITGKLRAFGNIEGKNVFYWFQNHKARQRQKQKQERFAYFSTLLHHQPPPPPSALPPILAVAPPPPPPPIQQFPPQPAVGTNVMCSPYYLPVSQFAGAVGFYQPQFHPPVFLPGALKGIRSPINGLIHKGNANIAEVVVVKEEACNINNPSDHGDATDYCINDICEEAGDDLVDKNSAAIYHETLQLFPLHPTGILEETRSSTAGAQAMSTAAFPVYSEGAEDGDMGSENHPFINFLEAPRGQC